MYVIYSRKQRMKLQTNETFSGFWLWNICKMIHQWMKRFSLAFVFLCNVQVKGSFVKSYTKTHTHTHVVTTEDVCQPLWGRQWRYEGKTGPNKTDSQKGKMHIPITSNTLLLSTQRFSMCDDGGPLHATLSSRSIPPHRFLQTSADSIIIACLSPTCSLVETTKLCVIGSRCSFIRNGRILMTNLDCRINLTKFLIAS